MSTHVIKLGDTVSIIIILDIETKNTTKVLIA